MTIVCSKCGKGFDSLIIDKETAWKGIYEKLLVHAKERHGGNLELLAQGVANACTAITINMTIEEFAIIPEEETWIKEHKEQFQDIILLAAGFDPDEEDDEDDEEEGGEELDPIIPEGDPNQESKVIEMKKEEKSDVA